MSCSSAVFVRVVNNNSAALSMMHVVNNDCVSLSNVHVGNNAGAVMRIAQSCRKQCLCSYAYCTIMS